MVKVAAVQMPLGSPYDLHLIDKNLEKILRYMSSLKGHDLVCFPELCLTGPFMPPAHEMDSLLRYLGQASRYLGLWAVVGGYVERDGRCFNETYVIDRSGSVAYRYRKKNLWVAERGITQGTRNRIIDTDFGKVGVIVCYDLAFPREARSLAEKGADIVLVPSHWVEQPEAQRGVQSDYFGLPAARAFENMVYLVLCDSCPTRHDPSPIGRSRIQSPLEAILVAQGEQAISCDLDMARLAGLRRKFCFF